MCLVVTGGVHRLDDKAIGVDMDAIPVKKPMTSGTISQWPAMGW